jgi:hypothetical protein
MPGLRVNARWYSPRTLTIYVEIYKCAVLTMIATLLAGIWLKTPHLTSGRVHCTWTIQGQSEWRWMTGASHVRST